MKPTQSAQTKYVSDKQVAERYAISRNTAWRWARESINNFPKPVVLNGSTRWRLSDLEAWEQEQTAA